jgi:hypothetical protein
MHSNVMIKIRTNMMRKRTKGDNLKKTAYGTQVYNPDNRPGMKTVRTLPWHNDN